MAIIYSYPKENNPQATDLIIGTSTVVTNGVKENVTRSYSIQTLTDYIKSLGGLGVQSITFTAPLTGGVITLSGTVGIPAANTTTNGYITSVDWNIFNSKLGGGSGVQDAITYWSSTSSLGSSSLSEPTGGTTVTSSKIFAPLGDGVTDLGISTTQRWLNLYLSGTASAVNFTGTNLTLTGTLSANGSTGTSGFILQSQGVGAAQWVDLSSAYDTYDLNATANGSDVDMNLTSTSGTDNSVVKLVAGTNVTLTRNTGVQVTIDSTDQFQGTVKSVTSADVNRITVSGTAVDPTIDANIAAVGSGSNNLATGAQIQTAIDTALTSALVYQGGYDAATNTPDLDSVTNIAITKGWVYTVTVAGDFFTEAVEIGDTIIAEEDMAVNGGSALSKWTTIQNNIDIATATTVGIASFPTGNNGLDITALGAVSAQVFSGANLTGGYVPDASAETGDKFLKRDGTWDTGPGYGVTSVATGNGLIGGTITTTGTLSPDYTSANNIILSAADGTSDVLVDADDIIFSVGNNVKYGNLSQLKTYIGAGTGTVTGSGTQYKIPFWSNAGGTALGDSMVAQDSGAALLTNTGSFTTTSITDSAASTGTPGQVLTAGAAGGAVTWGAAAASYTDWDATGDNQSPAVPISVTDGFVLKFTGATEAGGAGLATDSAISANEMTVGLINSGGTASVTTFYRGDGQWATPPAGTPTKTVDTFTGDASTVAFTLAVSPTSTAYIDIFIAGVYQQKSTYSLAGAVVTFTTAPPITITDGVECVSLT